MKNSKLPILLVFCCIFLTLFLGLTVGTQERKEKKVQESTLKILSSTENKEIESIIKKYAEKDKIHLDINYAGTLEIMDLMNQENNYDAIWVSNSIWLYMLENSSIITNSESTSINPILFGIKKKKAEALGFTTKEVSMNDILKAITEKKLNFIMSSATQTNTGASAYLGFLATLSGNKEILTKEDLQNENLEKAIISLLQGVERNSGSDEFLSELIKDDSYDALVSYESSMIGLNQELERDGKDPLYLIYPVDGVTLSDSPLAYVDHGNAAKKELFLKFQKRILSEEGQKELENTGRRTWYGGTKSDTDPKVFNKEWGIDTEKYLSPIKYPSTEVIKAALNLYQEELRKPVSIVFALDYSGSMYGKGEKELLEAIDYILNPEVARKDFVQFGKKDKITMIPFNQEIMGPYQARNGQDTNDLLQEVHALSPNGQTNFYDAILLAANILEKESSEYNTSIVLMTDGEGNMGSFEKVQEKYQSLPKEIPIYGILFGSANEREIDRLATLSKGKVFDGKKDLTQAFKEVRGYN